MQEISAIWKGIKNHSIWSCNWFNLGTDIGQEGKRVTSRRNAKDEKTMKALTLDLFLLLTLSVVTAMPPVFAVENEWEDEGEYE